MDKRGDERQQKRINAIADKNKGDNWEWTASIEGKFNKKKAHLCTRIKRYKSIGTDEGHA